MNSYPLEFLAHPQPLMFVAGLSDNIPSTSTTRLRSSSILSTTSARSSSRRPSHGASSLDPQSAAGSVGLSLTSPLTSPGPSSSQLPQSPPVEEILEQSFVVDERDQEFEELLENLRGALMVRGNRGKVWVSGEESKAFRILLVDKSIRLPLRKIAPPAGSSDTTPHSPLSPLIPSSPLYPDGLVAPVWVRKHADLVPAVFVLFLRLYESPLAPVDEIKEEKDAREKRDKEKEKEMDEALIKEIGDRRKRLGERGIKLTVVLMASASTLDSPSLDPRLSHLRRSSQLSAKASLFVLTPVPADQLPDFVQSLQDALYDSAMEYYGAHAKRVRRKRARLPTGQFAVSQGTLSEKGRPLGIQGWGVRYDWKSGWFAELRGEYDVARRHYEDCWNELAKMFTSTQTLPPRTKRWAEAKVLADCVAIRICRLLLYEGEGARVTAPFFVHVKRFSDLSRGWGIGEETFEFWSWIARQYRIFAELLEMALTSGLKLPPQPSPELPTAGPLIGPPTPEHWSTPISSTNPIQTLQQPAYYFYTAATCSVQRQRRYEEALEAEEDAQGSEAGGYVSTAPGFANEKKVDHAGLVVELFTKAYSLLKDQEYARDQAAIYVAFRIAETYSSSGQHELAMKFFERVAPTFSAKRWLPIVREIRRLWYECAQITGNVEVAARLLIEMMCPDSGVDVEERSALQEDLLTLLKTTTPSTTDPLYVDLSVSSILSVQAGFWESTTTLPDTAALQLVLQSPPDVDISSLTFAELRVVFSDNRPDLSIKHSDGDSDVNMVNVGRIGKEEATAPLRWAANGRLVLTGELSGQSNTESQVSSLKLVLQQGSWVIHLLFTPERLRTWSTAKGALTPLSEISQTVSFVSPPHAISLSVTKQPSAYVGEILPLVVKITSDDDRELTGKLSVFLQPGDEDDETTITFGEQQSKSLVEDIDLGSLASGTVLERTVFLRSPVSGNKMVDVVLHTMTLDGEEEEKDETLVVPVIEPFTSSSTVAYRLTGQGEGVATVRTVVRSTGPRTLHVNDLTLRPNSDTETTLKSNSLSDAIVPSNWDLHTSFTLFSQFRVGSEQTTGLTAVPPSPADLIIKWHPNDSLTENQLVETRLPLPPLILPIQDSFVTASIASPSVVSLHGPFAIQLELSNSHPSAAAILSVEVSTAEAFVWRGDRIGRVELSSGDKQNVEVQLVGVGITGWAVLPKITVWEERASGDEIRREIRVKSREGGTVYVRP